jgi:hypothetical protein
MPFGLHGAPATAQRLMQTILGNMLFMEALCFIDDVVVFGRTFEETLDRLTMVFGLLRKAGLKLKPSKCQFFADHIPYLGFIIAVRGITIDPEKTRAISEYAIPETVRDVRGFLGMAQFCAMFVPNFSKISKALTQLTGQKRGRVEWTPECQTAFEGLKQGIIDATTLNYPDLARPYVLYTDASEFALGACLAQLNAEGNMRAIAFWSKTLSGAPTRYTVSEKECMAVVFALRHYAHIIGN